MNDLLRIVGATGIGSAGAVTAYLAGAPELASPALILAVLYELFRRVNAIEARIGVLPCRSRNAPCDLGPPEAAS